MSAEAAIGRIESLSDELAAEYETAIAGIKTRGTSRDSALRLVTSLRRVASVISSAADAVDRRLATEREGMN